MKSELNTPLLTATVAQRENSVWHLVSSDPKPPYSVFPQSMYNDELRAGEMPTWEREDMREKAAGDERNGGIQLAYVLFGPTNDALSLRASIITS